LCISQFRGEAGGVLWLSRIQGVLRGHPLFQFGVSRGQFGRQLPQFRRRTGAGVRSAADGPASAPIRGAKQIRLTVMSSSSKRSLVGNRRKATAGPSAGLLTPAPG